MSATVVVPTWNGAERLGRLLESLDDDAQVIVVDNGSTDDTSNVLRKRFRDVDVLRLPRNEGFSRAVNRAAARATGDVLVLLNDDCVCEERFVHRLSSGVDRVAGRVMAAGVLLEARDTSVIDTAGMELDGTLRVFDYLNGAPVSVLETTPPPPIGPSGAAAAFDRGAFLEAGGFDEQLFAYWEDVDLVLRLRLAGAGCELVTNARAVHGHSSTLGAGSSAKDYLTGFGRGYVMRKWGVLTRRGAASAAIYELATCAAQLAFDRTSSGALGRVRGWKAAAAAPRFEPPRRLLPRRTIVHEAQRRWSRRRRVRGGGRSG
jgi:N-acetylglucosaminyl-diphospho-decaprenol L-rhamnosyltransferase